MLRERVDDDTIGHRLRLCLLVKAVVDQEIKGGGEVGHIAFEGLEGIDGYGQPLQVEPIVRGHQLLDVCIFIALHLLGGEAVL